MGNIVGGYDLPEVVVYGTATYHHTGDPSTCHECGPKLPGTETVTIGSALYTYAIWANCLLHKGEPCK